MAHKHWIVWKEDRQHWFDRRKGQIVKDPHEIAELEAHHHGAHHHHAAPAPAPQTLTEAPSAERELHEEEVNHYYGNQVEEHHSEWEE